MALFSSCSLADPRSDPAWPVEGNPGRSLHAGGDLGARGKNDCVTNGIEGLLFIELSPK